MSTTTMDAKTKELAIDLTREFPRSPRTKLAGYVVAARALDKCRAELAGIAGEYHYACPLDHRFLDFAEIDPEDFKQAVADGRDDEAMEEWIKKHARNHSKEEVIRWNNKLRDMRLSEMDAELQVFLEEYVDEFLPGKVVYHWFDVYDIEEGRIEGASFEE